MLKDADGKDDNISTFYSEINMFPGNGVYAHESVIIVLIWSGPRSA